MTWYLSSEMLASITHSFHRAKRSVNTVDYVCDAKMFYYTQTDIFTNPPTKIGNIAVSIMEID